MVHCLQGIVFSVLVTGPYRSHFCSGSQKKFRLAQKSWRDLPSVKRSIITLILLSTVLFVKLMRTVPIHIKICCIGYLQGQNNFIKYLKVFSKHEVYGSGFPLKIIS